MNKNVRRDEYALPFRVICEVSVWGQQKKGPDMKRKLKTTLKILAFLLAQTMLSIIALGLFWHLVLDDNGMPVWLSKLWTMSLVLILAGLLIIGLVNVLTMGIKLLSEYLEHRQVRRICRIKGHDWDGCACRRCGTKRDKAHDWDGCKCRRCSKTREEEHDWDVCIYLRCGKTREEAHDWNAYA